MSHMGKHIVEVVNMYESGRNVNQISKALHIPVEIVDQIIESNFGVKPQQFLTE